LNYDRYDRNSNDKSVFWPLRARQYCVQTIAIMIDTRQWNNSFGANLPLLCYFPVVRCCRSHLTTLRVVNIAIQVSLLLVSAIHLEYRRKYRRYFFSQNCDTNQRYLLAATTASSCDGRRICNDLIMLTSEVGLQRRRPLEATRTAEFMTPAEHWAV